MAINSARTIKRSNRNTRYVGKFILYVEGRNTESSYFNLLKRSNCQIEPVPQKGHGISKCVDFVNEAICKFEHLSKSKRSQYKEKWLVFDYDGRSDYLDAVKLAKDNGFGVAFSSMCIEYWFLLHFQDHDGSPIPMRGNSHSKAQIEMINDHIKKFNRTAIRPVKLYDSSSKNVEEDFFDLLMAIDPLSRKRRIVNALDRACSIHLHKRSINKEFSESVTTLYELLIALGVFRKTAGGWELFFV